jgi:hypothetical protein
VLVAPGGGTDVCCQNKGRKAVGVLRPLSLAEKI